MASIWSGLGATLGKQFAKADARPFLLGAVASLALLPKFAYDDDALKVSNISAPPPSPVAKW